MKIRQCENEIFSGIHGKENGRKEEGLIPLKCETMR